MNTDISAKIIIGDNNYSLALSGWDDTDKDNYYVSSGCWGLLKKILSENDISRQELAKQIAEACKLTSTSLTIIDQNVDNNRTFKNTISVKPIKEKK